MFNNKMKSWPNNGRGFQNMVGKNTTPGILSTHWISNMYMKIRKLTLYTKLLLQKEMKIQLIKASFKSPKRKIFIIWGMIFYLFF